MSYEGYVQAICENGHYSTFPEPYDMWYGKLTCSICKAKFSWTNSVDDTNCDAVGVIPPEILETFVKDRTPIQVCNLGHTHGGEVTYRIPSEEETKNAQHYWDGDKKRYVRIQTIPQVKKPNARKKK